jgi:uncharacterized protein (TIGR01244 family)
MLKTSGFMIACAVALGLATACQTRPVTSTAPATAAVAGIELHQPRQGLYTAGQPATGDWQAIAARGVTTVVNLRTPSEMQGRDEAAEVRAAGMRYIQIPIAGAEGITDANARLLRDALAAADGSVLVHCASANRAGGLLALAEARHGGVAPEQAIALGRKAGMASTEARVRVLLESPVDACASTASAAAGTAAQSERCP